MYFVNTQLFDFILCVNIMIGKLQCFTLKFWNVFFWNKKETQLLQKIVEWNHGLLMCWVSLILQAMKNSFGKFFFISYIMLQMLPVILSFHGLEPSDVFETEFSRCFKNDITRSICDSAWFVLKDHGIYLSLVITHKGCTNGFESSFKILMWRPEYK